MNANTSRLNTPTTDLHKSSESSLTSELSPAKLSLYEVQNNLASQDAELIIKTIETADLSLAQMEKCLTTNDVAIRIAVIQKGGLSEMQISRALQDKDLHVVDAVKKQQRFKNIEIELER